MKRLLFIFLIAALLSSCFVDRSLTQRAAWNIHPTIVKKDVRMIGRDTVWSTFLAIDTVGSLHHVLTIKGYELYSNGKHLAYLDYRFHPLHARFYIIPL